MVAGRGECSGSKLASVLCTTVPSSSIFPYRASNRYTSSIRPRKRGRTSPVSLLSSPAPEMSANPNLKQVSPASLDEIATRFNLLSEVEKQLPDDRRATVIRSKLSQYFKRQEQIKAAQANAAANGTAQQPIPVDGAAGNNGPARPLAPPQGAPNGGNVQANMAQQQHMQGGPQAGAQIGQSPRIGQMPPGQLQQQQPMNPGQQQVSGRPDRLIRSCSASAGAAAADTPGIPGADAIAAATPAASPPQRHDAKNAADAATTKTTNPGAGSAGDRQSAATAERDDDATSTSQRRWTFAS